MGEVEGRLGNETGIPSRSHDNAIDNHLPLQLDTFPVCRPEGLSGESIGDYLSKFSLSIFPVCISHLSEALCDPISVMRGVMKA